MCRCLPPLRAGQLLLQGRPVQGHLDLRHYKGQLYFVTGSFPALAPEIKLKGESPKWTFIFVLKELLFHDDCLRDVFFKWSSLLCLCYQNPRFYDNLMLIKFSMSSVIRLWFCEPCLPLTVPGPLIRMRLSVLSSFRGQQDQCSSSNHGQSRFIRLSAL